MGKTIYLMILFSLLLACSSDSTTGDDLGGDGQQPPEPVEMLTKVVAHRGAHQEFDLPENSRASFEKAIEIGSDVVECDVQVTKDAQLIVYHDEQIMGKFIKDLNYSELSEYPLGNGEGIPLLSDFLGIAKVEEVELWLDIKSLSDAAGGNARSIQAGEQAAELIREMKVENKVAYIVGRKEVLDKCIGAIRGDWDVAYMNSAFSSQQFVDHGYTWANFTYGEFYGNRALMEGYLEEDIRMSFYTIDDAEAMDWFLNQEGVYAVSTNLPALLISKIKSRNN